MRPAFSVLIADHDTLITTIIILINIIVIVIMITREKDDVLEVESEGRDADDELAARLEAGEVVSLGGKVIVTMIVIIMIIIINIIIISLGGKVIIIMRSNLSCTRQDLSRYSLERNRLRTFYSRCKCSANKY